MADDQTEYLTTPSVQQRLNQQLQTPEYDKRVQFRQEQLPPIRQSWPKKPKSPTRTINIDRYDGLRQLSDFVNTSVNSHRGVAHNSSRKKGRNQEVSQTSLSIPTMSPMMMNSPSAHQELNHQSSGILSTQTAQYRGYLLQNDEQRQLADLMRMRSPQIAEIKRQRELQSKYQPSPSKNQESNQSLFFPQASAVLSAQDQKEISARAMSQSFKVQKRQAVRQLTKIRKNAHSTLDNGNPVKTFDLRKNKLVYEASDALEHLSYEPQLKNNIINLVCKKVGLDPTAANSIDPEAEELLIDEAKSIQSILDRKSDIGKNVVMMQPKLTLEDQPGVFRQIAMQFECLDVPLSPVKVRKPPPLQQLLDNRESVSGISLSKKDKDVVSRTQRVPHSMSIKFKPSMQVQPLKESQATIDYQRKAHLEMKDQLLQNISQSVQEKPSQFISAETYEKIRNFELENGIDKDAFLDEIPENPELDEQNLPKRKRANSKLTQQQERDSAMQYNLKVQKNQKIQLAKRFKQNLQNELSEKLQNQIEVFNENAAEKFEKRTQAQINEINQSPFLRMQQEYNEQRKLKGLYTSLDDDEEVGRYKPRQRSLDKKLKLENEHNQKLRASFLQQYQRAAQQTATYYRDCSSSLYLTEQFCQGDKYFQSKNERLKNVSLAVAYKRKPELVKKYLGKALTQEQRAQKALSTMVKQARKGGVISENELVKIANSAEQHEDFVQWIKFEKKEQPDEDYIESEASDDANKQAEESDEYLIAPNE